MDRSNVSFLMYALALKQEEPKKKKKKKTSREQVRKSGKMKISAKPVT